MARLLGPDFLSLQVRDLSASRAFYTKLLGFEVDPRFDTDEFVLFETSTIPFGLAQTAERSSNLEAGRGVALWLDCDNVDALHARLQEAGVEVLRPPFDGSFGRTLVFADPDGYRITANQNPWDRFPLGGAQGKQSA
jgi:predicted enzyme related to lactoylglutathione lyase